MSLSANDSVGHLYGPWSQEAQDHLARVDAALGAFLDFLEARTGGGLLVALTADHGVLPLPEWEIAQGVSKCPVDGGRAGIRGSCSPCSAGSGGTSAPNRLVSALAPVREQPGPRSIASSLAEQGVPLEQAVAEAKAALESQPAIARAWTEAEIATAEDPTAELYRHSFVHGRSGDLVVQVAEGCLISEYDTGTTHGTPYLYDRGVPVLFRGPGVEAGRVPGRAATIDIGPTLAGRLGIPIPADLDGRPLPLVGRPLPLDGRR